GKMAGIFSTSFLCIKSGLAQLPDKATWLHILGVGMLGGIGLTTSIFVSLLPFSDPLHVDEAKLAVLVGSLLSGLCGYFFCKILSTAQPVQHENEASYAKLASLVKIQHLTSYTSPEGTSPLRHYFQGLGQSMP